MVGAALVRIGLILQNLYLGNTVVVMDRFNLDMFCRLVQDFKITYSYVVPPVVLLLAKSPIVLKYDLSSLRMLSSGGAPLTRQLVDTIWDRLKIPIKQGVCPSTPLLHTKKRGRGTKK